MIQFNPEFNKTNQQNSPLIYTYEEYSFYKSRVSNELNFTLYVNYIGLMVGQKNYVESLDGFCPYGSWISINLVVPEYKKGLLKVEADVEPGFSYRINDFEWPAYMNQEKWVCIGNPQATGETLEFLQDCVAVVNEGTLKSLWLKPTFIHSN